MAKLKVLCVYDSKAQSYATPMFFRSLGEALRAWDDESNRQDSMIHRHPEDYSLMELGEYDDQTGKFQEVPVALNHGLASQYKRVGGPEAVPVPRAISAPSTELTQ